MGPVPCGIRAATGWSRSLAAEHGIARRNGPGMPSEARPLASGIVRAPVDHIAAPPFPPRLEWLGGRPAGLPDAARVLGLLPRPVDPHAAVHASAWHERYPDLTVVGVHAAGFPPSQDPDAVAGRGRAARRALPGGGRHRVRGLGAVRQPRLAGAVPVRPARDAAPLPLRRGRLRRDRARDPGAARDRASRCSPRSGPRRRRTRCSSRRPTTSRDPTRARTPPAACGRCSTGAASCEVNGRTVAVDHPGAYELIAHERSTTAGRLALEIGAGVTCYAVCFTPGLAG